MKHFSFILMLVAVMAFISTTADAQSYRRNNGGLLIHQSSAGHYDPNAGSSNSNSAGTVTNSSNKYNMNINNSSAGHYDGPVTPVVTNDYNGNNSSTQSRVCSVCNGKGNYVHEQYMGAATAGKKIRCYECNADVLYGHTHRRCETCKGTGIIKD